MTETLTFTLKCVGCGHTEKVPPPSDVPMCSKCFAPCVVVEAAVESPPVEAEPKEET